MGGCYKVKMRSAVCIACQLRIRQTHTFARFFLLHSKFFFSFPFFLHMALIFHQRKGSWISPPLCLLYPSFFSSMYSTVPSLPFKLPCVFLSSSFNLFLLSPPLFPLSYLSISPGFTPIFFLLSCIKPFLKSCARFPSLIFFSFFFFWRGGMHTSFFSSERLVVHSPPTRSKTLMDTISRIPE